MISCQTAAVLVTLRDSPSLRATIASVRAALAGADAAVICVVNDPGRTGTNFEDGTWFVGAGLNLGWAAGVHAGLIGVESEYVWAIQDDLQVNPGTHAELRAVLEQQPRLGSVRPLPVDRHGVVPAGWVTSTVADDGEFSAPVPAEPTPATDLVDPPSGSFLPSSGQLIRRSAWDATGGFDPWFYPWGYIDVDFGRTLRSCGWEQRTVTAARMVHDAGGSTNAPFRLLCAARNKALFAAKWAALATTPAQVDPAIVQQVRATRGRPRNHDLEGLRAIAGAAAADTLRHVSRALPALIAEQRRPLEQELAQVLAARDDAVAGREAARADHAFAAEQFRVAAAARDEAVEQREEIFNSRAWAAVSAYWRLRRRVFGR